MKEIRKEIESAYQMISMLHVSGDAIDIVAAVRSKLRKAIELAKENEHG